MWNGTTPMELEEIPEIDKMDEGSIHELGHGVIAEESGLTIVHYRLWRNRGFLGSDQGVEGYTRISSGPDVEIPEDVYAHLLCTLAGQEAAAKFYMLQLGITREAALAIAAEGSYSDLKDAAELRKYYDISDAAARRETRRIIDAHWPRIVSGARKLRTRGRLEAADV